MPTKEELIKDLIQLDFPSEIKGFNPHGRYYQNLAAHILTKYITPLEAALDKYGRHFGECRILRSPVWSGDKRDGKCSCGFDAALRQEEK